MTALRLLIAAAALLLAGCLPVTSEHPVGSTVGLAIDPELIGSWKLKPEQGIDPGFVHFLAGEDNRIDAILILPGKADGKGEWSHYRLSCAKLGANPVMNVTEISENGKTPDAMPAPNGPTIPVLYRLAKGGRLTLYLLDEEKVKAAIAKGLIAGTVEGQSQDVRLTAAPAALDAFFARDDILDYTKPFLRMTKID